MPYSQSWLIEGAVALVIYSGNVTLSDVEQSADELLIRLHNSPRGIIHIMHDLGGVENYPTNVQQINRITRPLLSHKKVGWFVLYGQENPMMRFLITMIAQLARVQSRGFENYESAREFLQNIDADLPDLPHDGHV